MGGRTARCGGRGERGTPRAAARAAPRARRRRAIAVAVGLSCIAAIALAVGATVGGGRSTGPSRDDATARPAAAPAAAPTATAAPTASPSATLRAASPTRFREVGTDRLASPRQDVALAALGQDVLLAGGLDAADASSAAIERLRHGLARPLRRLPIALHDAPAVAIGGRMYLFGGGDGIGQHAEITAIDPTTGATRRAGALPAASSDAAAAAVGPVAYVVGGYTGTRWLDTIVAWRPGTASRVVAHLPHGVRYAAVAAAGPRVVIAGGTLPDGSASRDVFVFDSRTGTVRRVRPLRRSTDARRCGSARAARAGARRSRCDDVVRVARDRRGRPGARLDPDSRLAPHGPLGPRRGDRPFARAAGGRSRALRHAGGHDWWRRRARTPATPSPPSPPVSTPPPRRAG